MYKIVIFGISLVLPPIVVVVVFVCVLILIAAGNTDSDAVKINVADLDGVIILRIIQLHNPVQQLIILIVHHMDFRAAVVGRRNLLGENREILIYFCGPEEWITRSVPSILLPVDKPVRIVVPVNRVRRHVIAEGFSVLYKANSIREVIVACMGTVFIVEIDNMDVVVCRLD